MLMFWGVVSTLLAPMMFKVMGLDLRLSVLFLMFSGLVWLRISEFRISRSSGYVALSLALYYLVSIFIVVGGPCNSGFLKFFLSFLLLSYLIVIAFDVGAKANRDDWLMLQKIAPLVLIFAVLSFVFEMLNPSYFPGQAKYRAIGEYSGYFGEPSHVAFLLFPWVAILLVSARPRQKMAGFFALVCLLFLSRSTTLIAITGLWFIYDFIVHRRLREFLILVCLALGLGAVIGYGKLVDHTLTRVEGVINGGGDLSSVVYVQGWQDAFANLERTQGAGLGFNMMGCSPLPDVPARTAIWNRWHLRLNGSDGSFLFSKVTSELGLLGVFLYVAAVWWWLRLELSMRKPEAFPDLEVRRIQAALMFTFLVTALIRSASYFEGDLLLYVLALAGTVGTSRAVSHKLGVVQR